MKDIFFSAGVAQAKSEAAAEAGKRKQLEAYEAYKKREGIKVRRYIAKCIADACGRGNTSVRLEIDWPVEGDKFYDGLRLLLEDIKYELIDTFGYECSLEKGAVSWAMTIGWWESLGDDDDIDLSSIDFEGEEDEPAPRRSPYGVFGRANGRTKLTEDNVRYIRAHMDVTNERLASMFAVSTTCISKVKRRKSWGWLV